MGRSTHDDSALLLVRNQSIKRRARKFCMSLRKVGLKICPAFAAASFAAVTTLNITQVLPGMVRIGCNDAQIDTLVTGGDIDNVSTR